MKTQLRKALDQGRRIIYVDEAMFTTATLPSKAFALKGQNIELDEKFISLPSVAVVAGVSAEEGLEAFYTNKRSIDSDSFI